MFSFLRVRSRHFYRGGRSLTRRLSLIMALGCMVVLVAVAVFDWVQQRAQIEAVADELALAAASRLGPTVGSALYQLDQTIATAALNGVLGATSDIAAIIAWETHATQRTLFCGRGRDAHGDVAALSQPPADLLPYQMRLTDLRHDGQVIGQLLTLVTRTREHAALNALALRTIARMAVIGLILLAVLILSVQGLAVRPLRAMAGSLRESAQGVAEAADQVRTHGDGLAHSAQEAAVTVARTSDLATTVDVNGGPISGHETEPHGRPWRSKIRPVLLSENRLR